MRYVKSQRRVFLFPPIYIYFCLINIFVCDKRAVAQLGINERDYVAMIAEWKASDKMQEGPCAEIGLGNLGKRPPGLAF